MLKDGIRALQTLTQQKQKPRASTTPQKKSLADESFFPQPHKLFFNKPLKKHKTLTRFQSPGFSDWTARCHTSPSIENIPLLKWLRPSLRDHSSLWSPNLSVSMNVKTKQQQNFKKMQKARWDWNSLQTDYTLFLIQQHSVVHPTSQRTYLPRPHVDNHVMLVPHWNNVLGAGGEGHTGHTVLVLLELSHLGSLGHIPYPNCRHVSTLGGTRTDTEEEM